MYICVSKWINLYWHFQIAHLYCFFLRRHLQRDATAALLHGHRYSDSCSCRQWPARDVQHFDGAAATYGLQQLAAS